MKINFRSLVFGLFLSVFFVGFNAGPSEAQYYDAEKLSAENFDRENRERFKEWRASIPNYEKRLYDRLKTVNSRTVRIQNILIGVAFLVLLNFVLLFALYNREIDEDSSKGKNVSSQDGPKDDSAENNL